MIKINLLGDAAPQPKGLAVGGPPAPKATQVVVFVGALIILFGTVGVIYKILTTSIADFTNQRSKENLRKAELAGVKAQNDKYQQRLKDLETRINTIQALQNSRVGPVELMSALGDVVNRTSDVFLYTMAPAGDRLQLKGQSGTVDSMANFLAFLKKSGFFTDVQLDQFFQDDIHERLNYKFTVSCLFKSSTGGASPTAGGPAAGPGGPGAPGGPPAGLNQAPTTRLMR
jgi:Tfp pilus assembly protein PilN